MRITMQIISAAVIPIDQPPVFTNTKNSVVSPVNMNSSRNKPYTMGLPTCLPSRLRYMKYAANKVAKLISRFARIYGSVAPIPVLSSSRAVSIEPPNIYKGLMLKEYVLSTPEKPIIASLKNIIGSMLMQPPIIIEVYMPSALAPQQLMQNMLTLSTNSARATVTSWKRTIYPITSKPLSFVLPMSITAIPAVSMGSMCSLNTASSFERYLSFAFIGSDSCISAFCFEVRSLNTPCTAKSPKHAAKNIRNAPNIPSKEGDL